MAKIAFILLCHKDPEAIIKQAQRLTAAGDFMAIHFDARAKSETYQAIKSALDGNANVTFVKKRVRCGWGEWSLVEATLRAVQAAVDAFPTATHFYMLSGDCMAIKSATYAHAFLDKDDVDYIEHFDFFESDWIKTGMKEDRLIYRHIFNERLNPKLFYASYEAQKKLGLTQQVPHDLQMMIGSQWWCLRRGTVESVLDFCRQRTDVTRFFKTTWIPDETFFQTLVPHLVPADEITARTLTFLMFTDYGMPVTFYNDHYDLLLSQDFLFARKISPEAMELKERLGDLYASDRAEFNMSNEGRTLFSFLSGRGRIGRRFGTRIWERETSLGPTRELFILACKKWHVAKRLLSRILEETDIKGVEYLFDEQQAQLPDVGRIENALKKRNNHQLAFLKLLFDCSDTNQMIVCIDPSNIELLHRIFEGSSKTRLLEIECTFDDDYLLGHAKRVGLAGEMTSAETIERLLPTVRHAFEYEFEQIRNADFSAYFRIGETQDRAQNAAALASFLGVAHDTAESILSIDYLFVD